MEHDNGKSNSVWSLSRRRMPWPALCDAAFRRERSSAISSSAGGINNINAAKSSGLQREVRRVSSQPHYGGSRAFYRPSTDSIQLPPREAFIGSPTSTAAESFYSTLCHELIHFTSAESRCNRQLGKRFGDQAYAVVHQVPQRVEK
jgi:hypothetical protein